MGLGKINEIGVGVGYRPAFHDAFLLGGAPPAEVSWVEVITENFLPENGRDTLYIQNLRRLRERLPVALHGVSLSLASAAPLDPAYLGQLAWLEREIEPWLVSDHLCFTGYTENLFDLLPFPLSKEALAHVGARVQEVQELLRRPLALENITYYARPAGNDYGEAEFLNALASQTGCRLLLDINNIYVNAANLGQNPRAFLEVLDHRHVAQVHLAGHSRTETGLLLDTHGAPVAEEVWALYEWFQRKAGLVPVMIERDENIPEWEELVPELRRLAAIRAKGGRLEVPGMAEPRP
jgi:uncharacterized protein (UPF0276 family)